MVVTARIVGRSLLSPTLLLVSTGATKDVLLLPTEAVGLLFPAVAVVDDSLVLRFNLRAKAAVGTATGPRKSAPEGGGGGAPADDMES